MAVIAVTLAAFNGCNFAHRMRNAAYIRPPSSGYAVRCEQKKSEKINNVNSQKSPSMAYLESID